MQVLRKSLLVLVSSLLVVMLLTFGIAWSAFKVLGTPEPLKRSLRDSGIYAAAVGGALDQAQKNGPKDGQADIPVDQPDIRVIIERSFPPEFLQTQTESALDSIYAWLHGQQPELAFSLNLTEAKTKLADGIGQYVQQRLATLPACTSGTASGDIDAFTATCLPRGYDIAAAAEQARSEILDGEFLQDSDLTAENIKNDRGETLADQLRGGQTIYSLVTWGIFVMGLLVVILAAGTVFLSSQWRSGLRKLGIILIVVGAFSALAAWAAHFGLNKAVDTVGVSAEDKTEILQQKALKAAELLSGDLRRWGMIYAIGLVVLGVVALVVMKWAKRKGGGQPTPEEADKDHSQTRRQATENPESAPAVPAAAAPAKRPAESRPKPKKKLIQ